jgi:hypothetical protein
MYLKNYMVQWQIENEGGNKGCTPPLTKKPNKNTKTNKGNTKRGVSPRLKIRPCDLDL